MGRLIFRMRQSLDGHVDHATGGLALPPPGQRLQDHLTDHVCGLASILYGRHP